MAGVLGCVASVVGGCGEPSVATTDFVHYVIHFAAVREGRACEMCRRSGDLGHTHYFQEAQREDTPADTEPSA